MGQEANTWVRRPTHGCDHISPSSSDRGPYLVGGRAVVGHVVPGGHESPRGGEGDLREVLVDVLGDACQQLWVSGLSVEDIPSQDIVDVPPVRRHEGAPVGQGEGVGGVLADPGAEGNHAVVVDLRKTPGRPRAGGDLCRHPAAWSAPRLGGGTVETDTGAGCGLTANFHISMTLVEMFRSL